MKHHLEVTAAAEPKPSGGAEPQNLSLGRGQALPCRAKAGAALFGGLGGINPPPQVVHPPDVEEQHLGDAQQAGGDGEGKEGDADEDVLGLVAAAQREGCAGGQEETAPQEPLRGARVSGGAGGPVPVSPSHPGVPGLPSPHLHKVEHKGGHPAPAVQAVHVGDALGAVGLEDSHDACGEEPVTPPGMDPAPPTPITPSPSTHPRGRSPAPGRGAERAASWWSAWLRS